MRISGVVLVLASTACRIDEVSFTSPSPDPSPDALACFGSVFTVCLPEPPAEPARVLSGLIDTSGGDPCMPGLEPCVIAGTSIEVRGLRVTGTRPLVLLATSGAITISAELDAASHRFHTQIGGDGLAGPGADPDECFVEAVAPSGTGGGYGGSHRSLGGAGGGRGANDGGIPGPPRGFRLDGGCGGWRPPNTPPDQAFGRGGGAVALIAASSIEVQARINASGAGGHGGQSGGSAGGRGGGGGGGSGGTILLDAPAIAIGPDGSLMANGGGGGEGGGANKQGAHGDDPVDPGVAAPGGTGGTNDSGKGGKGAIDMALGEDGRFLIDAAAGGGGGGGVGRIRVSGTMTGNRDDNVSPPLP